jgi:hypothetical protein
VSLQVLIAGSVEQAAHDTGGMVMVDVESRPQWLTAQRARTGLKPQPRGDLP